jgi:hypothetical protein
MCAVQLSGAVFQQYEIDYTLGQPVPELKIGAQQGPVPIIRIFGITNVLSLSLSLSLMLCE